MAKKRSKIIKDLIMNKIDVLQALQSLDFMLEDIKDKKIKKWVQMEIYGYKNENEVPNYRRVNTILIGDIQIGYNIYNHVNIPFVDKEAFDFFSKFIILEPVSVIEQYALAEKENEHHSLSLDANLAIVNKYQTSNGEVIRAHRELSLFAYNNVLSILKDKLLNIFKLLEDKYGNLDEMYIDFSDKQVEREVSEKINNIIYTDKSIHIGDGNTLKSSNVGDNNEN